MAIHNPSLSALRAGASSTIVPATPAAPVSVATATVTVNPGFGTASTPDYTPASTTGAVAWDEAVHEFLLHKKAAYSPNTAYYYEMLLRPLVRWCEAEGIPLHEFGKRHMDRYTAFRAADGKARLTLRSDGVAAKNLFFWCVKNDLLERSKLAEYEVHNAPKPHKHMPSDEEMARLLLALAEYWDPASNQGVKFMPAPTRLFHRVRNTAIIMGLVDTACRIGEALGLKVDDVKLAVAERSVVIREAKGKEPRTLPVGPEWADALDAWIKVRARVMAAVPPEQDEGWLFISDTGGRIGEDEFLRTLKRVRNFAGLSREITLHSLRRYSLNKLAKHNLLMAQAIAGHKDTKTTLGYTKLDPEFVRRTHREASPLGSVMGVMGGGSVMSNRNQPPAKKRRLV